MTDELVHLAREHGVATITLDSPHNRNALSRQLLGDLRAHLDAALVDAAARVIVIEATGPAFCAGADLKEARSRNEERRSGDGNIFAEILSDIWQSPKPVVARVQGPARAGGIGLMAACDISVAVESATFGFSEVRIGVAPAIISVVVLPKIGITRGMEYFLTGNVFDARTAAEMGLITSAVPATSLDATVAEYVEALRAGGPHALGACKRLVRDVPGLALGDGFAMASPLSAELFASDEAREGMTAFAEKRQPSWLEALS
ncbi:MAG: enoyl-CoA hydratase-related protein [Dehalococcoidia bacterium]